MLLEILNRVEQVKVLIVGDVMLDRYWFGAVSRISPEAPVPIVRLERVTNAAGGAANVAANVLSLGGTPFLVGVNGSDEAGRALHQVLEQKGVSTKHLIAFSNRPTTTKTRIVAHQQQVVRIDEEDDQSLTETESATIWRRAIELLPQIDVVVLSDYAKGCLCGEVTSNVIEAARKAGKKILVDPKGKNYAKYNGATLLTPNKMEAAAASDMEIANSDMPAEIGEKLLRELQIEALLITLGEDGMGLAERGRDSQYFPAMARQVYDVTGAGDTVIAALAVALGANADLAAAVQIANAAAGLAVEQVGTATVKKAALEKFLSEHNEAEF
jgi:rfaE bifunctional protein kinase chain/domain